MLTTGSKAAAAARIGAGLAVRKRAEVMGALRSCFADADVAALAIRALTAAELKERTDLQAR